MMVEAVKNDWVTRVLGVRFAAPVNRVPAPSIKEAANAWRNASESVDAQIAELQAKLRETDDEELHEIADIGLNAVTGGFKVPLMAALNGAERGDSKEMEKLATIIPRFRTHLETNIRVRACDENPHNVKMSVRATLIPALDVLARSVAV